MAYADLKGNRFYAKSNASSLVKGAKDFKRRRQDASYAGLTVIILSALTYMAMQGWVLYNLLRFTSSASMPWDLPGLLFLQGATALLFIFLTVFFTLEFRKLNNHLDCAEFQNLLFSSSMNLHAGFSFIINKDRDIVYSDNKSAALFGYEAVRDFTQLAEHKGISERSRAVLIDAVSLQKSTEIIASYKDSKSEEREIRVSVDPLTRPNGYCVIRGFSL